MRMIFLSNLEHWHSSGSETVLAGHIEILTHSLCECERASWLLSAVLLGALLFTLWVVVRWRHAAFVERWGVQPPFGFNKTLAGGDLCTSGLSLSCERQESRSEFDRSALSLLKQTSSLWNSVLPPVLSNLSVYPQSNNWVYVVITTSLKPLSSIFTLRRGCYDKLSLFLPVIRTKMYIVVFIELTESYSLSYKSHYDFSLCSNSLGLNSLHSSDFFLSSVILLHDIEAETPEKTVLLKPKYANLWLLVFTFFPSGFGMLVHNYTLIWHWN